VAGAACPGRAWLGPARHNKAGKARHGKAGPGEAEHDKAGKVGLGMASSGWARQAKEAIVNTLHEIKLFMDGPTAKDGNGRPPN